MTDRETSRANARSAWGRIRKNIGILLGERAVFAVVNVVATGVATRAVGLEAIGVVGLLLAYSRLISDATKFQSWQAIIRYGAPLKAEGERPDLRRLIGMTTLIDAGAVVFAIIAAWIGAVLFGDWLGWSAEMISWAPWFCVIIAFITHMTPTGVLRLFDRVPIVAIQHAATATFRLIGSLALLWWGGGAFELALIWCLSAVFAGLLLYAAAAIVLVKEKATPRLAAAVREGPAGFTGFWKFVSATNAISTLDLILPFVATLIVGATLGPVEAGVFHLVRQVTEAMARPGDMLGPLFMPELALMEAKGDRRAIRRMVIKALIWTAAILAVVVLVFIVAGEAMLALLFGPEAAAGHDVLILAGIATAIYVWGFTLEPTLLSLGKAGKALWSILVAWLVFIAVIYATTPDWGLVGIGFALIGHRATQFLIRVGMVARLLRTSRI